ncbi:DUF3341 domain-containing protein [soil metagenome]
MSTKLKRVYGYLAEFDNAQDLHRAAEQVRDAGFKRWDVHSPYPIHGMDAAMGLGRSRLPHFVFVGGAIGLATGFSLAFLTQVVIYPTIVQGKPANIFTTPAFFPVMFELTILFSAFTTLFTLLVMMGLPRLNHPIYSSRQFHRTTDDAFFIAIEARDPQFSQDATRSLLEKIGGRNIELVEDEV